MIEVVLLWLMLALPFGLNTLLTLGTSLESDSLQFTLGKIGTWIKECESGCK